VESQSLRQKKKMGEKWRTLNSMVTAFIVLKLLQTQSPYSLSPKVQ